MYILEGRNKGEFSIFKEKTTLSREIGCSTRTILRNEDKISWDWKVLPYIIQFLFKKRVKEGIKSYQVD